MKIWYQTMSSYRHNDLFEVYGKTLEDQIKKVARPDTEIYVTGVPNLMLEIDRFKSIMYYHRNQVTNNMLKAGKEGYDAFIIGCTCDGGMDEGREMLSIPVIGISNASLYMSAMLGEMFAIVTCEPWFAQMYRQLIIRYGLQPKHLPGPYIFPIMEEELARALKDPEPIAKKFEIVARKAVADGASVIIPIPPFISQFFYKTGQRNLAGALVLDPVSVAVKVAEMFVDLKKIGIEVSRTLQVYGSPGKELLQKCFDTYRSVFKIET